MNKKVKNATKVIFDGLKFDSKLELFCYQELKKNNINFEIKTKFILQEKFMYLNENIREIYSLPDFYLPEYNCIIDTKGFSNDVAPLKYKMLKYLFYSKNKFIKIYICKNKAEVLEVIKLIKDKK